MEAKKEKEIGYALAKCCANCKFLLRRFWARKQSTECWKHHDLVKFYAVCDSFEPGSGIVKREGRLMEANKERVG